MKYICRSNSSVYLSIYMIHFCLDTTWLFCYKQKFVFELKNSVINSLCRTYLLTRKLTEYRGYIAAVGHQKFSDGFLHSCWYPTRSHCYQLLQKNRTVNFISILHYQALKQLESDPFPCPTPISIPWLCPSQSSAKLLVTTCSALHAFQLGMLHDHILIKYNFDCHPHLSPPHGPAQLSKGDNLSVYLFYSSCRSLWDQVPKK